MALIGGVFSIYFTSGILSIPAIIGFITLFGVATRNGILLVSHYNTLCDEGVGFVRYGYTRLKEQVKPHPDDGTYRRAGIDTACYCGRFARQRDTKSYGKVILGGLLTSTLLNIFIVPAVYYLSNKKSS
ncbi:efflux RND transporter permease subunit [Sphingobacterium daejeonense]|uniref:efflux RND transporter permease subunit n=1 Tax=Sphingobacterium daejeonense TaxID=371142 RepID=UPI0010C3F39F|nr:Cation efflux system protein CzcA [Sphingobacterium daejeonense]